MTAISRPALVVFQGGASDSPASLESLVLDAQRAATLDLLALASSTGAFERAFLVTEDESLERQANAEAPAWPGGMPLRVERAQEQAPGVFHFGEAFHALCARHKLERVVYVGGGSLPLGTTGLLSDLALAASGANPCVVANNLYSADHLAFWPASALGRIELPPTDNNLAWLLHYRAGLPFASLPRSLNSDFDIDTPVDLATLWWYSHPPLQGSLGPHLRAELARVPARLPVLARKVEQAYRVMSTRRAEVLVVGRVSSYVWRRLETNLPCQTRIISEERGMQASGREARGEVRSFMGMYIDQVGVEGLVASLPEVCNAAFIDSRVLFAHRRLSVSRPDRFASDALVAGEISDAWVQELTQALADAALPIIPGGHSLVSGGVWALSERVRNTPAEGEPAPGRVL